jgi:hypothetical protein
VYIVHMYTHMCGYKASTSSPVFVYPVHMYVCVYMYTKTLNIGILDDAVLDQQPPHHPHPPPPTHTQKKRDVMSCVFLKKNA